MIGRRVAALTVVLGLGGVGVGGVPAASAQLAAAAGSTVSARATGPSRVVGTARESGTARVARPLAGRTIVVDPGHQLGNSHYPREINRLVPAGGFSKPCNSTGTATNGGYPEASMAWRVSRLLRARLVDLGARVLLTRTSNREDRWGPCVDARGRAGNRAGADLKISVHGDGSTAAGARGFHVIAPTDRAGWTHDIYRSSRRLALTTRDDLRAAGVPVSTYAGRRGLDFRGDLGTLNLSNVPTVMVELGNMRNAADARRMTTDTGRATYARALTRTARDFLGR